MLSGTVRASTKPIPLSINNLFDTHNIYGVQQAYNTTPIYKTGSGDQLSLLPGCSIALTVTFGLSTSKYGDL